MPAIYVDRVVELGQREGLRDGYLQALANCREAGLPIAALSEEEVEKIGTERWQLWRGPGRRAYREESWTWGYAHTGEPTSPADLCNFKLAVDGQHGYLDTEESTYIDLGSNERSTLAPELGELAELELNPAIPPTEEEIASGREVLGVDGPVSRIVSGQPCQEWAFPDGATTCIWSGGVEWGFAYDPDGPLLTVDGMGLGSIILEAKSAPGSFGARLTTTRFTINAPLNLDDMKAVGAGDEPENRGP